MAKRRGVEDMAKAPASIEHDVLPNYAASKYRTAQK
jgi:hypothetical protein